MSSPAYTMTTYCKILSVQIYSQVIELAKKLGLVGTADASRDRVRRGIDGE